MDIRLILMLVIGLFFSFLSAPGLAEEELSLTDNKAMEKTLKLLLSPQGRAKAGKENPEAQKAIDGVSGLGLSKAGQEKLFYLTSKIFKSMTESSAGNSSGMLESLQNAQRDPSSLKKFFSKEDQKILKELAEELSKKQNSKVP